MHFWVVLTLLHSGIHIHYDIFKQSILLGSALSYLFISMNYAIVT